MNPDNATGREHAVRSQPCSARPVRRPCTALHPTPLHPPWTLLQHTPWQSPPTLLLLLHWRICRRRLQRAQVGLAAVTSCYYRVLLSPHWALNASCAYVLGDVGSASVSLRPAPRRDSAGKPICELCPRRLTEVKGKLYQHGAGRICQRCYNKQRPATAASGPAAAASAPLTPSKRRADSDPGRPRAACVTQRTTTRRISPPASPTRSEKRMARLDAKIARLLEETHARRMASLAANAMEQKQPASNSL